MWPVLLFGYNEAGGSTSVPPPCLDGLRLIHLPPLRLLVKGPSSFPAGLFRCWYNGIMRSLEYPEACAFHEYLEVRKIRHFHCPNETGGNPRRGAMNKRIGVVAGIPDFFVFLGDGIRIVIELKEPNGGSASPAQKSWLEFLAREGFHCAVCHGAKEAIEFVEEIEKEVKGEFLNLPSDPVEF